MKVYDTSGTLHNWTPKSNPRFRPSSYHDAAIKLIEGLYPLDQVLQEVHVPGENIYLDVFLPSRKLVVEVNGEQHYKFNAHFYETQDDFRKAKLRDKRKADWCQVNNFDLVVLDFNQTVEDWENAIIER